MGLFERTTTIGERYGKWTVFGDEYLSTGRRYVVCTCECGTQRDVSVKNLLSDVSRSCGCSRKQRSKEEKTGIVRHCRECGSSKDESKFRLLHTNNRARVCKDCENKANLERYYNHSYDKGRKRNQFNYRVRRYGIEPNEYWDLLEKQNNCCAICLVSLENPTKYHVDHCHNTGEVRGLLCHTCNSGIGMMGDSVERLESAIRYLNESN